MPFPLVRYLSKVTAIHSHCDVLLKHAHSPRLRRHLHNTFRVSSIQLESINISMPQSWGPVIKNALDRQGFIPIRRSTQMQKIFRELRDLPNPVQAPVHCECALIHHFQRLPETETPALNYLGVSRLSCKACALFIKAFDNHGRCEFYTRGSHHKWTFPWALPRSRSQVLEAFYDSVSLYIANSLSNTRCARTATWADYKPDYEKQKAALANIDRRIEA
jgi:hypothetical protein